MSGNGLGDLAPTMGTELQRIRQYVADNPMQWELDSLASGQFFQMMEMNEQKRARGPSPYDGDRITAHSPIRCR